MNPYYKTLEIEQGADRQTIKKAYFKMIRKYPPDKNPAEFKKIREAYEYLQKEENLLQLEWVETIPPEFEMPYYQVLEYHKNKQLDNAIALCVEILKISKMLPFQVLLATYYNENRNYGKASALWEKLHLKQKNNTEFLMGLLVAYQGRNWVQKAIGIGEQLEKLGYRNLTFYSTYADLWFTRENYEPLQKIVAKAIELYESTEKHTKREADYLCNTIDCLLQRELEGLLPVFQEDAQNAGNTIKKGIQEPTCSKVFARFAWHLYILLAGHIERYQGCLTLMLQYQPIVQLGMQFYDEDETLEYKNAECKAERIMIDQDKEIEALFKDDIDAWYRNYLFSYAKDKVDFKSWELREEQKYDQLLYWVNYLDRILPGLKKIAKFYPNLAKAMSPYLEEMLGEDQITLRKKYEKCYKKVMGYPASANLVLDSDSLDGYVKNSTYRRDTKKVGRNDPCPCGSGKKYKKCCGKN